MKVAWVWHPLFATVASYSTLSLIYLQALASCIRPIPGFVSGLGVYDISEEQVA